MKHTWPAWVAFAVSLGYVLLRLNGAGGDPAALADIGTRFSEGDPNGTEGYDGQFALVVALDPAPEHARLKLDVPAYRYQRILYPLLARVLALGRPEWIPWALIAVNLVAHTLGTFAVCAILRSHGVSLRYALGYGLWIGLVVGVGFDLNEPLALALLAAAWLARTRGHPGWSAAAAGLALFAKETSMLLWAGWILSDGIVRDRRAWAAPMALAGVPFAAWQVWLHVTFGATGLASGGAQASPFEWIPFMGLWRVGAVDLRVLGLYLLIFGPSVLLPAIWGAITAIRSWRIPGRPDAGALLVQSAAVAFLPFSTFREPLAVLRFASGLVLAVLVTSASSGLRRPLNYSLFWVGLLVILVNG
jgi:hypothetical protein